uniref:40S ribosomal protein S12 n=1 Tax=Capra hircus TaxID=9925 RepID=A0A452DQZ1_CAPHI
MAKEGIAAGDVMDLHTTTLIHYGLAHEIRKAAKALDKRQAHPCVLASNCDVKLVEALCVEHQINLIKADDSKLRECVGLLVGCGCVVVKDYGKESQAKNVTEEYFKCKK